MIGEIWAHETSLNPCTFCNCLSYRQKNVLQMKFNTYTIDEKYIKKYNPATIY